MPLTLTEAKRLKVGELREHLVALGLDASGTKDVLVERLVGHHQKQHVAVEDGNGENANVDGEQSARGRHVMERARSRSKSAGKSQSKSPARSPSKLAAKSPSKSPTRSPAKSPANDKKSRSPSPVKAKSAAATTVETAPNDKKKRKKRGKKVIEKRTWAEPAVDENMDADVTVEYVAAPLDVLGMDASAPDFHEFQRIFEKFTAVEGEVEEDAVVASGGAAAGEDADGMEVDAVEKEAAALEQSDDEEEVTDAQQKPSGKKKNRLSVAQLKQLVDRPDVVEWFDVSAADPRFLIYLKSYHNTVPVPQHWCSKKRYLSTRRRIEKPQFALPDFIKDTGIGDMRDAIKEKEDEQKLKAKARESLRPKLGKVEVDYQKLHDAFFRHQTKPYLSVHGDLYHEGKEFEARMKEKRPGVLSTELRELLGMAGPYMPPPWLLNMQRFGPPPAYPNLRIPGLNAPIPEGCQWGYHPGGWGKPPVDEFNRPLYGDVFGLYSKYQKQLQSSIEASALTNPPVLEPWGELEPPVEEEEVEEEEEEQEAEAVAQAGDAAGVAGTMSSMAGFATPAGMATPGGLASTFSTGLYTPGVIELRKDSHAAASAAHGEPSSTATGAPKTLYTVVPQVQAHTDGMMGSEYTYDLGTKRKLEEGGNDAAEQVQVEQEEAAAAAAAKKRKTDEQKAKKREFKF